MTGRNNDHNDSKMSIFLEGFFLKALLRSDQPIFLGGHVRVTGECGVAAGASSGGPPARGARACQRRGARVAGAPPAEIFGPGMGCGRRATPTCQWTGASRFVAGTFIIRVNEHGAWPAPYLGLTEAGPAHPNLYGPPPAPGRSRPHVAAAAGPGGRRAHLAGLLTKG
jgi:hypothetical protein